MTMKVLVLAGGRSSERDVSLATGAAVSRGLHDAGYEVLVFDPASERPPFEWTPDGMAEAIATAPPDPIALDAGGTSRGIALTPGDISRARLHDMDLVFICLHGGDGENGRLQALLDTCGIRYTGSGMAASALAMDKHTAKRVFVTEDIPTPRWGITDRNVPVQVDRVIGNVGIPLIVKPNAQGSTVGLTLVRDKAQWDDALAEGYRWDDRLVVEEYISGREITVGILDGHVLPVVEIIPTHDLYDYECKYTSGQSQYVCPAALTDDETNRVQELGLRAYLALGCAGYARVDFRMNGEGTFYCLEVNTLPGMTRHSLVPKAADADGITFPDLLTRICKAAVRTDARE